VFILARTGDVQLVFSSWSLFAQDTWTITPNLTLTYGLRWDYNAAPTSPNGTLPFTVTGVENLATAQLAPPGTPLWHSQKHNFAPRFGLAWHARTNLVVRAGAGIFYDLGYAAAANGMIAFPYAQQKLLAPVPPDPPLSFPLSDADAAPPPFTTSPP